MEAVGGARIVLAVAAALLLGVWLRRCSRTPGEISPTVGARLRTLTLLLLGFFALAWIVLAGVHLFYPYELEWHGGAWRDHCERLLEVKPLYAPPTPAWIPFAQPPLYVALCALLMKVTGNPSFAVMRLVSIACTLGSARLLFLWVRRLVGETPRTEETPSFEAEEEAIRRRRLGRIWAWTAVGLFLTAYRFAGVCYDREQPDMLFLFLLLLGGYWLECSVAPAASPRVERKRRFRVVPFRRLTRRGNAAATKSEESPPDEEPAAGRSIPASLLTAGAAGGALALAFLTHVGALLFLLGGGLALAWRRAWPQALFFCLVACLLASEIVWALNETSQGGFVYYCFRVLAARSMASPLAWRAGLRESLLYAPCAAILLLALTAGLHQAPIVLGSERQTGPASLALPIWWGVMGALLGLFSRALWSNWEAVPVGYTLLIPAACIAAGRWERAHSSVRAPLMGLLLAQAAALAYVPTTLAPTWANAAAGRRIGEVIRTLETQGEVLTPDHGGLTVPGHFHISALQDVLTLEKRLPLSFTRTLSAHRYVAVMTDTLPQPGTPFTNELLRSYAPAEGPEIGGPWVVTGRRTPPFAQRVWVLRPRAARLR